MKLIKPDELIMNFQAMIDNHDSNELGLHNITAEFAIWLIKNASIIDAIPVVRCKDCKHKPTGTDRDDLEFPDDKCPCQCEDYWYSWKPVDDWYCGNGEWRDGNA